MDGVSSRRAFRAGWREGAGLAIHPLPGVRRIRFLSSRVSTAKRRCAPLTSRTGYGPLAVMGFRDGFAPGARKTAASHLYRALPSKRPGWRPRGLGRKFRLDLVSNAERQAGAPIGSPLSVKLSGFASSCGPGSSGRGRRPSPQRLAGTFPDALIQTAKRPRPCWARGRLMFDIIGGYWIYRADRAATYSPTP